MDSTANAEFLQEGKYHFTRFYCREGFMDKWMGSKDQSPSRDTTFSQSPFLVYYRLNGVGPWISSGQFMRFFNSLISRGHVCQYGASDLWNRCRKLIYLQEKEL